MSSGSLPFASYHRASHLGDGSFGSVVTVYNDDGAEFALKLFIKEDSDDDEDSESSSSNPLLPMDLGAMREISCLRLLRGENRHENIIELQDVQADWDDTDESGGGAGTSGCLGMAIPLGKHGSLADAIGKGTFQGYPKKVKVQLAHGLLSAVCFLHDNGILHRDIKSDNVLLEHKDDDDSWKAILIDFSLAKPVDGTMWGSTSAVANIEAGDVAAHTGEVGTVVYTAPEIVAQECYGKPSDLFSVGVVLLELLTNSMLSAGKPREAAIQVQEAVNKLPENMPFADLIRRLLNENPQDRLTARQALDHPLFTKFGMNDIPETRLVNIATALPYDEIEENEPPNAAAKTPAKQKNKKVQKRLQLIDKVLHELDSKNHLWTRSAALEYSQQLEQLDDTIDDLKESQSLADCCVLAHRFFELEEPDLEELEERESGPFANWSREGYVDNEATIFLILDYCLYPRKLLPA